jgi:hypothetical protein
MSIFHDIAAWPLWAAGLVLVVLPTLAAMCGPLVVRRFFGIEAIVRNNEVAGFKFATLGVIYAVLLGLAVIAVWEKFAAAEEAAAHEAGSLATTYRLSTGLDEEIGSTLRNALTTYARSVVEDGWPAMAEERSSPRVFAAVAGMYDIATSIQPSDAREEVLLEVLLTQLDDVTEARRDRLALSRGIVPDVIWLVLVLGAVITIGFTFFFGLHNIRAQMLMTAMLSLLIFLALFVALSIDHPFSGAVRVPPEAMELVLADFTPPGGAPPP